MQERKEKRFVLTFIAPAHRCNQNCINCFITKVRNESAHQFDLTPADYAKFTLDFLQEELEVVSLTFQGFEVTLAKSWPYVEKVFELGNNYDVRCSFITNGMLLHRYTDRITYLDPARISVSLDGSDRNTNDYFRGLDGAFDTALASLRAFIESAHQYRERIAIISVLYGANNYASLLDMPRLLKDLGIEKWGISIELTASSSGSLCYSEDAETLLPMLENLQKAAIEAGIKFFIGDEFDLLDGSRVDSLYIPKIPKSVDLIRLLPSGHVYVGSDAIRTVARSDDPKWDPRSHAADFVGSISSIGDAA